jgi:signal transduction histidine kinase
LGSRLAHDINTPLDALRGHLDLIAHEPISDAARESVRTCQRELGRLQTTAQDLLAFTRLRAGGGRRAHHAAGALAEEAAAALLDRADELGASLTVDVPSERVIVDAAEGDLLRALRNLIGNALTHGLGERRDVRVTVAADADTVTFSVADSGAGLTPDDLARLSQPLTRGDGATGPGSGLGLAIVSEVLAAHGSALTVALRAGGGAVLSFTLPRVDG